MLTLAFVDRHSGGGSGDGFDRVAGDSFDGAVAQQELEMTSSASAASAMGEPAMGATNGRTGTAKNGHGAAASRNGLELSPGPSRGVSPMKSKKKGEGAGMGMYARVGGDGVDEQPRREFGMLEESSSDVFHERGVFSGSREENGSFRDGGGDERQTLALGRSGEVEGQMEVGGGDSRWDDDNSDGSGHGCVGARSGLVEPA